MTSQTIATLATIAAGMMTLAGIARVAMVCDVSGCPPDVSAGGFVPAGPKFRFLGGQHRHPTPRKHTSCPVPRRAIRMRRNRRIDFEPV